MDYRKHGLEESPPTETAHNLLTLALAVARERGYGPTHWSQTALGLDSASAPGLMLWDGTASLAAIAPDGHMYWVVS